MPAFLCITGAGVRGVRVVQEHRESVGAAAQPPQPASSQSGGPRVTGAGVAWGGAAAGDRGQGGQTPAATRQEVAASFRQEARVGEDLRSAGQRRDQLHAAGGDTLSAKGRAPRAPHRRGGALHSVQRRTPPKEMNAGACRRGSRVHVGRNSPTTLASTRATGAVFLQLSHELFKDPIEVRGARHALPAAREARDEVQEEGLDGGHSFRTGGPRGWGPRMGAGLPGKMQLRRVAAAPPTAPRRRRPRSVVPGAGGGRTGADVRVDERASRSYAQR